MAGILVILGLHYCITGLLSGEASCHMCSSETLNSEKGFAKWEPSLQLLADSMILASITKLVAGHTQQHVLLESFRD